MKHVITILLLSLCFNANASKRQFYNGVCSQIAETNKYVNFRTYLLESKGIDICKNIQNEEELTGYTYKIKLCEDYSSPDNKNCNIKEREVIVISSFYYKTKVEREAIKVKAKTKLNALKNI